MTKFALMTVDSACWDATKLLQESLNERYLELKGLTESVGAMDPNSSFQPQFALIRFDSRLQMCQVSSLNM